MSEPVAPAWSRARLLTQLANASFPLPGRGHTVERWRQLAELAGQDLSLAKLLEAHADAVAILNDLHAPELYAPNQLWAVWAASDPRANLTARRDQAGRWLLSGQKAWCSGHDVATHALVTAQEPDNAPRLLAVALDAPGITSNSSTWAGLGMRAVSTARLSFEDVPAQSVGASGAYLERPGFWHGGGGITACWWGGATAVGERLRTALAPQRPHAAAQLGRVDALLSAGAHVLRGLARQIDADPAASHIAEVFAARRFIRSMALDVVERVCDALGPGPLCGDAAFAQRCADLQVWVRQHHAGGDDEALGGMAHRRTTGWTL